jgi:AcrR family transcriptional regulator
MEGMDSEAVTNSDPSLGRRERKKIETRTALHRAAIGLFSNNGFRQTRISEIVDAANVSESTFFRYFDGKEGVALEGLRQRAEAIVAAVRARPIEESPIDACLAVNRDAAKLRLRLEKDDLPGLEFLRETPELASKAHLILHRIVGQLAEEFARRLDQDASSLEVKLQTHVVLSASIAALEVWIADPTHSDPQRLSQQALIRLRDGLRSTPQATNTSDPGH